MAGARRWRSYDIGECELSRRNSRRRAQGGAARRTCSSSPRCRSGIEDGARLFVHAGIRPGIPLRHQREDDLLWIRDGFLEDRARLTARWSCTAIPRWSGPPTSATASISTAAPATAAPCSPPSSKAVTPGC